jgi:glycosyltransferase involved in cell wall biosynthesis
MQHNNKIVIISSSFFESSIPLAKNLSKDNCILFYSLVSSNFQTPPNFDLSGKNLCPNIIYSFDLCFDETHYIKRYLNKNEFEIRTALFDLKSVKIFILLRQVINEIRAFNPILIHFIGCDFLIMYLHIALKRYSSVQTFHEIDFKRFKIGSISLNQIIKNNIQKSLIRFCINRKIHLIFHSKNVRDQFISKTGNQKNSLIPFGIFEIYNTVDNTIKLDLPEDSFLFFGYIRDYKGTDIFIKAIEYITENFTDIPNFVIVGKDASKLETKSIQKNLHLVDKFLTDDELGNLVRNCKAVIAPHKIASQSGIPNTAFAFFKPVICSNIPGLSEFIIEGKNGLLFESENPIDLANKIMQLHSNANLYAIISNNIINNQQITIPSWAAIAQMTQKIYSNEIK